MEGALGTAHDRTVISLQFFSRKGEVIYYTSETSLKYTLKDKLWYKVVQLKTEVLLFTKSDCCLRIL